MSYNSQAKTVCFFKQETYFPAAAGSLCQSQGGWQTPLLHSPGVKPCPPLQSRYQPSSPGQQLHNLPLQLPVRQPGAGLLPLPHCRPDIHRLTYHGDSLLYLAVYAAAHKAGRAGDHRQAGVEVVQHLLQAGSEVNQTNLAGLTALHQASRQFSLDKV